MDISAENTFTPARLAQGDTGFDAVITGTFVATVTIQISKDGDTWIDMASYTDPAVKTGILATAFWVRAGIKTGDYTSGTASVEIYD